jgi:phage FluMu protein Com
MKPPKHCNGYLQLAAATLTHLFWQCPRCKECYYTDMIINERVGEPR